jgi:hypothetical protein
MRHLLGFLVIVLLILTPSCKWLKSKGIFGKKADTMAVWQARQDSLRVIDSVRKAQERILALENARQDSLRLVEEENLKNKFNIIIGSFITPEYARKYSEEFAGKGYKTRILKLEGTQFEMVSAEAHSSYRTAVTRLKEFQDTVAYDAWIYVLKKQN